MNEERNLFCCPVTGCEYTRKFFRDDSDRCLNIFWMHVRIMHRFSLVHIEEYFREDR